MRIQEAVELRNQLMTSGEFTIENAAPPGVSDPVVPVQKVLGLPIRGTYNSNQILGNDYLDATNGTAHGPLRSRTFPIPSATSVDNTAIAKQALQAAVGASTQIKSISTTLASTKVVEYNNGILVNKPFTGIAKTEQATLDPSILGVVASKGSVYTSISGSLTYASDTSSITWSWTSLVIYRADGTQTSIPDGSQAFTGLTSSTTYFFYPAYIEATGQIVWYGGAQTAVSVPNASLQTGVGVIPLSLQVVSAATTSSGSGGGSGGGAGGGGGRNFV